ncbi:sodium:alanine symporter family protein [Pseudoflavonifractor sp. MSJ-37]|uniref:alanine/glycine:cation symporter family protein n=1 Tax=Pseudoflavonifractor sp. MSJ-37 TaxID=2841531 RepID=UPI001C0F3FE8|nr:alanine/glycine:cation symporter family protein [Pseudoflavonifractor sp. MSJ-37]MBU5434590.1 alanine:cation symporter family protein [Pseudoflavonifractor sp. MSJ-37]
MSILAKLSDALWDPWLLGLFLFTGLWWSCASGFFQLFALPRWLRATAGQLFRRERSAAGGLTQLQALSTALASTIGTGSIAGVAAAIFWGGPGAVFWMWISALLGMMTSFAEKALAVRFHEPAPGGGWQGGPMCFIQRGLGLKRMARFFSLACLCASLGGGSLVQANSIAASLQDTFGWDPLAVGLSTALACSLVIFGGVGRIGRVSERLVPLMALLFLGAGGFTIAVHAAALPSALRQIAACALSPEAAGGYGMAAALRYGVARGVFTNEAGMGSSAIAHAAAQTDDPASEGLWGIFETGFATLVICSVTALAVLTSGVYDPAAAQAAIRSGTVTGAMLGAPLSAAAFSTALGDWGGPLVSVCLLLFAFTSLLGWSYYGERALSHLAGEGSRKKAGYRALFLAAIVLGSVGDVSAVWQAADLFNGLMALPVLTALLLLTPEGLDILRRWEARDRRLIPDRPR